MIFLRSKSYVAIFSICMDAKLFGKWEVFNNFLLIETQQIDHRSKISSDQKRLFIVLSLYPLSFFANTAFNVMKNPALVLNSPARVLKTPFIVLNILYNCDKHSCNCPKKSSSCPKKSCSCYKQSFSCPKQSCSCYKYFSLLVLINPLVPMISPKLN